MKEGRESCKARLLTRGFEEVESKGAATCSEEIFKTVLAIIRRNGWQLSSWTSEQHNCKGRKETLYLKPPAVLYWREKLTGVVCSHMDDFCYGGNKEFENRIMGEL